MLVFVRYAAACLLVAVPVAAASKPTVLHCEASDQRGGIKEKIKFVYDPSLKTAQVEYFETLSGRESRLRSASAEAVTQPTRVTFDFALDLVYGARYNPRSYTIDRQTLRLEGVRGLMNHVRNGTPVSGSCTVEGAGTSRNKF